MIGPKYWTRRKTRGSSNTHHDAHQHDTQDPKTHQAIPAQIITHHRHPPQRPAGRDMALPDFFALYFRLTRDSQAARLDPLNLLHE
jgi:hypothetical protein